MKRAHDPPDHAAGSPWWSKERLEEALIEAGGNRAAVARRWGTSPTTIDRWIQNHELEVPA